MSEEEIKESYLKLPNVTVGELQDVVDFMEDNDIEYVEFYEKDLKQQIEDLEQKVEQLEKENKILKENAEHNDKVVDKVNWENMLLKGKLKDLKERIMLKQLRLVNEETYNILHSDLNELLEVLDEEIKYEQ